MNPLKNIKQNQGFTLIELMLAIGLLSILMLIAMPNLSQFVQRQKLSTHSEMINSAFSVARAEALNRLQDVRVCWNPRSESADATVNGYAIRPGMMVVLVPITAATSEVIRDVEYDADDVFVDDDEADNCVTYDSQGRLDSFDGQSLVFGVCRWSGETQDSRSVSISPTGRPVSRDNVNGGVATIDCT